MWKNFMRFKKVKYLLGTYYWGLQQSNKTQKPDHAEAYHYRGVTYFIAGKELHGYSDAKKAAALGDCSLLEWTKDFGKPFKENVSWWLKFSKIGVSAL